MSNINLIIPKESFHHHRHSKKSNLSETHEIHSSNETHSARRKFMAEAALATKAIVPTVASDAVIEADLRALNDGVTGAWAKLMLDIGGAENLSTYRTKDGLWSLLDLCGRISDPKTKTLTNTAMILLDPTLVGSKVAAFSYSADGQNDLAPRYQWGWDSKTGEEENDGYCGETSFITAGLANGEYISQYDARQIAVGSQTDGELLIGDGSDVALAKAMHLNYDQWNQPKGSTKDFIAWLTKEVESGHPVAIGMYLNPSMFGETGPGDPEYDHIVIVTGIKDGKITFCDNGLKGGNTPSSAKYTYTYPISEIIGTRADADKSKFPYTIPDFDNNKDYHNHGIAIDGVKDKNSETLPIHLLTNVNNEPDEIKDHSNVRPPSTPVTLTGCISGLTPGKTYKIYVYDALSKVPDGSFNKNASKAARCITFTATGTSYAFTDQIKSSDQIAFRVVPADGP